MRAEAPNATTAASFEPPRREEDDDACACVTAAACTSGTRDVSPHCDCRPLGVNATSMRVCYVRDPTHCATAVPSLTMPHARYRSCDAAGSDASEAQWGSPVALAGLVGGNAALVLGILGMQRCLRRWM